MINEIESAHDAKDSIARTMQIPVAIHDEIAQRSSADDPGFTDMVMYLLGKALRRERVRDLTEAYNAQVHADPFDKY
jgi:hypothetical protein